MADPNMKILVVDDSSMMRRIVRSVLQELGFINVWEASDGVDALSKLRSEDDFEFVITDWSMPNMSGIELIREIRTEAALRNLPVLMMIADKRENIIEAAEFVGASGYVVKPFSVATLDENLRKIFLTMQEGEKLCQSF